MHCKKKKIKRQDVVYDNTDRDLIPKRGYYSELVSDMTKEHTAKQVFAKKRMKLLLQAKTDKLAPMVTSLAKPQKPKLLLPPGRWTTYSEDDSVKMLRERGVQPFVLMPPSEYPVSDEEYYGLYSPYPKMDLELFDNTDFDCRIPEEWLSLGFIEGEQYPCPGLAFIPKQDGKPHKPSSDLLQMLNNLYEAELLYRKIEGKMKIIHTMQMYPNLYNFIDPPSKDYVAPVPDYGRYPCDMVDFDDRMKFNQWKSLYVLTESVSCIHLVVEECLKVEGMLFFTSNYGRNVSLAEFDAAQQHCTSMYPLRYCLEQSMAMFVALCETPCLCTYWCEDDYEWDPKDLINTPFRTPTTLVTWFDLLLLPGNFAVIASLICCD
ncbi:unnamed protein product [Danaus chrysippus]|uniref:(African queen) hypothetical protein n=1 Tax=Danaus chrysippus TaxID=151541 RepID=A0A8J2QKK1_9NEOP|nr:unnamed protein product [Danaus chrysippus]